MKTLEGDLFNNLQHSFSPSCLLNVIENTMPSAATENSFPTHPLVINNTGTGHQKHIKVTGFEFHFLYSISYNVLTTSLFLGLCVYFSMKYLYNSRFSRSKLAHWFELLFQKPHRCFGILVSWTQSVVIPCSLSSMCHWIWRYHSAPGSNWQIYSLSVSQYR